jgi:hypothetical protein
MYVDRLWAGGSYVPNVKYLLAIYNYGVLNYFRYKFWPLYGWARRSRILYRMTDIKLLKFIFGLIGILIFFALSHICFIFADQGIMEINPVAESQISDDMTEKMAGNNGRLVPNNQNEIILSIGQWKPNTYVDIRVPIPERLMLAKSDMESGNPSLTYVSSLENWRKFNKLKSGQPFTDDLLVFDLSSYRLSSLEEAPEEIKLLFRDKAVFFGNISDTYMGFRSLESSDNNSIALYGFTKVNTEYVALFISFMSQGLGPGDLDLFKKMMEDYFLKLREINNTPLLTYERKPVKKCAIPGGESVNAAGETILTFKDCMPESPIMKKVPVPDGLVKVEARGRSTSKFTFVSDIEAWEKYEKLESGESFNERLTIINVVKHYFSNTQEARESIVPIFVNQSGELNTFGDLPDTYMAVHSSLSPGCGLDLMGNTKIHDEYVQVYIAVKRGCPPSKDDGEVYKKMMIEYFKKIREANMVTDPVNHK